MGFLKDLKKITNKVIDEMDKAGVDRLFNVEKPARNDRPSQPKPAAAEPQPAPVPETGKAKFPTDSALFQHFDDIITRNFAQYEVRRNVPAKDLKPDCHPACTPVQFLFYAEGTPKLAVVLVRANTYRGMNVLGTREICESQKIDYMRFFIEYDNEEDYVVNRISSCL